MTGGRIGKSYPVVEVKDNKGNTAQASIVGDRFGWIVALVIALAALILSVMVMATIWGLRNDVENIRGLVENSAASASQAAVQSAVAAERADKAERSAALSREYAVQVYPQLNRLGYPVLTPGEEGHPQAQPEDYERLERFKEQHQ
jgi:hypothetical protein